MLFMVTAGAHVVTDPKAKPIAPGAPKAEIQYHVGETLESNVDLAKKFPGKFKRILTRKNIDELPEDETPTNKEPVEDDGEDEQEDNLESLSVKELRDTAVQMRVSLNGLKTKEEIIAKLRESVSQSE
jgi:hypothetical protein